MNTGGGGARVRVYEYECKWTPLDQRVPVETQRVQKRGQAFHRDQDAHSESGPRREEDERGDEAAPRGPEHLEAEATQHHCPQHVWQLFIHINTYI